MCARLRLPAVPFLIAAVFASNIGGTATLIGDPPNIMIASRAGLSFNDFLIHLAPVVAVMLVAFLGLCRFLFRDALRAPRDGPGAARAAGLADLRAADAITDRPLLVRCLVVLALVIAGFTLHTVLHLEPAMVALLGAGLMVLTPSTRSPPWMPPAGPDSPPGRRRGVPAPGYGRPTMVSSVAALRTGQEQVLGIREERPSGPAPISEGGHRAEGGPRMRAEPDGQACPGR